MKKLLSIGAETAIGLLGIHQKKGQGMRFQRFVLSSLLMVCFSPVGFPQASPREKLDFVAAAWNRTVATKCPLSEDEDLLWVLSLASPDNVNDYFVYTYGINPRDKVVTTWVRHYDYNIHRISLQKYKINKNEQIMLSLGITVYDMNSGTILSNKTTINSKKWENIIPGTIGESFLNVVNSLEGDLS